MVRLKVKFLLCRFIDLLFTTTALILAYSIWRIQYEKYYGSTGKIPIEPKIIDFHEPIFYGVHDIEYIRFHEVLAYTQYECNNKMFASVNSQSFPTCTDRNIGIENFNQTALIIIENSRRSFGTAQLFSWLNVNQRITFPTDDLSIEKVIESVDNMQDYIIKRLTLDFILKIDAQALNPDPKLQIYILERILAFCKQNKTTVNHIHLTMTTPRLPNAEFWFLFTGFLYKSFFDYNYALMWCTQLGACSNDQIEPINNNMLVVNSCEYRITLIKIPEKVERTILAPISGLGSPAEEYKRLLGFLNANTVELNADTFLDNQCAILVVNSSENANYPPDFDNICSSKVFMPFGKLEPEFWVKKTPRFIETLEHLMKPIIKSGNQNNLALYIHFDYILQHDLILWHFFQEYRLVISPFTLWLGEDSDVLRKMFSILIFMQRMNFDFEVLKKGDIDFYLIFTKSV